MLISELIFFEKDRTFMKLLTPTELICKRFGGIKNVSSIVNIGINGIYRWQTRRGGRIPDQYLPIILKAANLKNIKLTATELIEGGIQE